MKKEDNIFLHKHIVLGGENFNTLSIIRSLGEAGLRPIAIIVQEGHISVVKKSRFVGDYYPTASIEGCIEALLRFSDVSYKPFVYTCDDNHGSELDQHFQQLIDKFFFFNAGRPGQLTHLMNKKVLCELANEFGFSTPNSEVVNRGELPTSLRYPVFTKTITPYSQGWKRDVGVYSSPEELKEAYKHMITRQFLLQEFIPKKNELEIHGFSVNGGNRVYLTYCSLYYRNNKTSFGYYKYFFPFSSARFDSLYERIAGMIREANYSGVFEVEFLVDENENLVFLEINFRFALSNYACTFGGVNLPVLWAKASLAEDFDEEEAIPKKTLFSFMNEVPDFRESVRTHKVSFITWINECLKSDCLVLFHKNDIAPFFSYIHQVIRRSLSKRFLHSLN